MLTLLLDEHISVKVAAGLRRREQKLSVYSIAEWDGGDLLGRDDAACLQHAAAKGLTLVTYDRRTIPPLLKTWAEEGRSHGGIIFVDEKTIPPWDIGGLVRSLLLLWKETGKWNWKDRVCFLQR